MLGNKIEIVHDGNIYDNMVGKVIEVGEIHVLVEIQFAHTDPHKVFFFKEQVKPYHE